MAGLLEGLVVCRVSVAVRRRPLRRSHSAKRNEGLASNKCFNKTLTAEDKVYQDGLSASVQKNTKYGIQTGVGMKRKIEWVSQKRLQPYLEQTANKEESAWALYEWNAAVSAALSEVIHHVEVLLRNSMMQKLETIHPLAFPWNVHTDNTVGKVAARLTNKTHQTAPDENDIISQLNLGFWVQLIHSKDFQVAELWNTHLNSVFPGKSDRKVVGRALEDLRELRNRVSHQDSLLHVDPIVELRKILRLAKWIDPDAATWIESISKVDEVLQDRPGNVYEPDTVLFASTRNTTVQRSANKSFRYPLFDTYHHQSAIILEDSVRVSREVKHLGFYLPKDDPKNNPQPSSFLPDTPEAHIAKVFPLIQERFVPQDWSHNEVKRLKNGDQRDQRIAAVMGFGLSKGYRADRSYIIYLLSGPTDPDTARTSAVIIHDQSGKGSAFVKLNRYLRLDSLKGAHQTSDLI
ncbi:hypothetical protein QP172_09805 [Corynebacterium coyleae]|uniref:Abi-like protein n=1 Tax=Corynebacterium coyleae TaxID=53374 RepID=A0AAP7CDJ8_9CORY|nr:MULTISPECIES: hypothetical protein [Corynebacterium]MDK6494015.1 hypothetical protein [Corynebacterium coyleae]MDK8824234.1 hypothetical protein [Corynebacterium coyleae]NJJ04951.1 hypothetical protein [Corynebacterium coyleae]UBI09514.1 hypothetical protein LA324_02420 [Corynebacterium coyleae]